MNYDQYLSIIKLESHLWSVADFFLVYYLTKLFDCIRSSKKKKPHKKLYYFLWASLCFWPALTFSGDLKTLVFFELFILNLQYFVVVFVLWEGHRDFHLAW